jgi:hypothetical protein
MCSHDSQHDGLTSHFLLQARIWVMHSNIYASWHAVMPAAGDNRLLGCSYRSTSSLFNRFLPWGCILLRVGQFQCLETGQLGHWSLPALVPFRGADAGQLKLLKPWHCPCNHLIHKVGKYQILQGVSDGISLRLERRDVSGIGVCCMPCDEQHVVQLQDTTCVLTQSAHVHQEAHVRCRTLPRSTTEMQMIMAGVHWPTSTY